MHRVALISLKKHRKPIGWELREPRINKAPVSAKRKVIVMSIKCYSSTGDSNDDGKDQFNEWLQPIVPTDLIILKGDPYTKVRLDNTE